MEHIKWLKQVCQLLLSVLMLSACDTQSPDTADQHWGEGDYKIKAVPEFLQQGMPEDKAPQMLTVSDPRRPSAWLLARYQQENQDQTRTEQYYLSRLEKVAAHVHEEHRVIANRVVQTSQLLAEHDLATSSDEILQGFSESVSQLPGRVVFGDLCAYYANLRLQGLRHTQAMQQLFESF